APWYAWRGRMLRALRATMHGRFAEAERLADEALHPGRAGADPMGGRIWTSTPEAQLRAAERRDALAALLPSIPRHFPALRATLLFQAMGVALTYARLEDEGSARQQIDLLPAGHRPPFHNLYAMFFVAEAVALAGPSDFAVELLERIRRLPDEYVVLGMSY